MIRLRAWGVRIWGLGFQGLLGLSRAPGLVTGGPKGFRV